MALLLTITESDSSIISGVPEFVEFETNEPATVFYTLDGSEPDEADLIAIGRLYLPTHSRAFVLKARAFSFSESSDILEEEYSTDNSGLNRTRNVNEEGIVIIPAGEYDNFVDYRSVNLDGQEEQRSVINFLDLEIVTNTRSSIGESLSLNPLETKTTDSFINFQNRQISDEIQDISSVHDREFNPNAKLILIDGSTQELMENQSVKIINRSHGTINPISNFYNDHVIERPIVSGNFVRVMYNPSNGKAVYYYRESRDNRWIKSTQAVNVKKINAKVHNSKFVFRWIEDRVMSKIY